MSRSKEFIRMYSSKSKIQKRQKTKQITPANKKKGNKLLRHLCLNMSNKWQIKCDSPGYSRLLVDLNRVLAVSSLLNYCYFCQKTTLIFFAQLPECCIWTNIFDKCVDVDAVKIMCIIYCAPFCKQGYHTSKGAWSRLMLHWT